jgi:hypothetical protein
MSGATTRQPSAASAGSCARQLARHSGKPCSSSATVSPSPALSAAKVSPLAVSAQLSIVLFLPAAIC